MKIDFKISLDSYKAKVNEFRILEIPPMQYLMIDGHGDPNTSAEFASALTALYPVAYKLKFMSKLELDYVVPPLEALWWAEDMENFTERRDKSQWDWTLMLLTPDWINQEMFSKAQATALAKGAENIQNVRLETLNEEIVVQTLHLGSYDNEGPTLDKMHNEFIPEHNYKMVKKHHEIYFSDFRRVAPEKLKTILRQPIEKVN